MDTAAVEDSSSGTWFDNAYGDEDEALVAYFCAEFGIHKSVPIYSGGLGVLAGDHLKSASELDLPLVGIGLLYQQGYFRQRLNADGDDRSFEQTFEEREEDIRALDEPLMGGPGM